MWPVSLWRPEELAARLAWRDRADEARQRLRAALWPAVGAAIAAGVAWLIAHDLLGHTSPFFAPIAAAISLSSSGVRRGRRIVQMVLGVTLGIAIGEAATKLAGVGPIQIGAVVLVTMALALLVGVGIFSEGMMFVNQSVSSAVIVLALRTHGTGSERLIDAWIGGGVALVIGVGLFPTDPVAVIRSAEREVLRSLSGALARVAELLEAGTPAQVGWTLAAAQDVHHQLSALAQARASAAATARIAPRRWRQRAIVAIEGARVARFDLLANASLSLFRASTAALDEGQSIPRSLSLAVNDLASALGTLTAAPQPWPAEVLTRVRTQVGATIDAVEPQAAPRAPIIATLIRSTGRDLLTVLPAPAG